MMSEASNTPSVLDALDVALRDEAEFLLFDYPTLRAHMRSLVDVAKAAADTEYATDDEWPLYHALAPLLEPVR